MSDVERVTNKPHSGTAIAVIDGKRCEVVYLFANNFSIVRLSNNEKVLMGKKAELHLEAKPYRLIPNGLSDFWNMVDPFIS